MTKKLFLICMIMLPLELASPVSAQYFSLETPKIYSPGEKVIVNLSSQEIQGSIFFRAYKIENPPAFFQRQSDPHSPQQLLSVREANAVDILRSSRSRLQRDQRQVFRDNMSAPTRTAVKNTLGLETFSAGARANRLLSVLKDYSLLLTWEVTEFKNPEEYSYRDVEVDLKEPGAYLIEAFNERLMAHTVVVISHLGMITKSSPEGTLVFVSNKKTGEPMAEVNLRLIQNRKEKAAAVTDKNGMARFAVTKDSDEGNSSLLVLGQKENHLVLSDPYYWGFGETRQFVIHAYTERPIYRPSQTVYFKGMVRIATAAGYEIYGNKEVEVKINDNRGTEVYRQTLKTNANGTYNGELTLGDEPPLGTYELTTSIPDGITHYASFKVEEYKKPEYKVEVITDKDQYANGDLMTATIKADYYFGSPVANAQVDYYIFRGRYWRPWWHGTEYAWYYEDEASDDESNSYRAELLESDTNYLDENGRFTVRYQTEKGGEDADYYYRLEARVVAASRRQIIGSKQVVVTRGLFMISTYTNKYVYSPGEEVTLHIKAEDFKNNPICTKIGVEVYTREWKSGSGWENKKKIYSQSNNTDASGKAAVKFNTSEGGYYLITANGVDARGNKISTQDYCWVSAGAGYYSYESKGIEIIPDRPSYQAGETAHVLVISPVKNVWALITAEGPSILHQQVVNIKGTSQVVDLKIEDRHQPNFAFAVALLANDEFYSGSKNVLVIPEEKFLDVEISANKEIYRPQDGGELTVKVTNKKGDGVETELSVGIVDESIYALAPDMTRDIKKIFYSKRYNRVSTYSSIYFRFYGYSRGLSSLYAASKKAEGFSRRGLADVKAEKFKEARVRKDFRDTMFWQAQIRTNSDGIARIKIRFPDNLTTWRTTVRAISERTEVGEKIHKTIVRQDLIVRMETPRFFMQGDALTISTITHNYLSQDKQVKVSLQGDGIQIDPAGEKIIIVPPNGEKRIDWTVRANDIGTATLTAKALTNEVSDAMQLKVPVLPHGLKISEAMVVDIEENQAVRDKTVVIPTAANSATAELHVAVSPSLASSLLSALEDLAGYPYGCVEQTMSRFLPTAIVAYTAKKLNLNLRLQLMNELPKMMDKGLKALYRYQHADGGWGWWENDATHPYMSAYVVYGLALTRQTGHQVDDNVLARGANNLARQLTQARLSQKEISGLGNGDRNSYELLDATTQAYMLYALQTAQKAGVKIEAALDAQLAKLQKATINDYARALLAMISHSQNKTDLANQLATQIENNCLETGTACSWGGKSWHYNWQDDYVETTAFAVKSLVQVKYGSPRINSGIRYLLAQKRGNAWRSTKDTAMIIFALVDYLEKSKELEPNYNVKIYLNDRLVFEKQMTKNEALRPEQSIRLNGGSLRLGDNRIRIEKEGPGKFYSSFRSVYYAAGENLKASTVGFGVKREYFKLAPQQTTKGIQYTKAPFNGTLRSGDEMLVKVSVTSSADYEYFMLEDPLPAGAEVIKDESGYHIVAESAYRGPQQGEYESDYRDWYAAREIRDEKVAFFATRLPAGRHEFTYLLRAQIPGDYHVMPPLATLMYYPEYQGNGNEMRLRIIE